tara:strand:- start:4509 stop:4718 length:210 start_codon:yes stop_codon:yes gene_type:complete
MSILEWFDSGKTVVKTVKSKYTNKPLDVTVNDIRNGYKFDEQGNKNEVAFFVRKNRIDRMRTKKSVENE